MGCLVIGCLVWEHFTAILERIGNCIILEGIVKQILQIVLERIRNYIILEGIVKQILQIVLDRIGSYIILERIVKQILQIVLETMFLNFANLRVHVPLGLQDSLRFGVQQLLVLDEPVVLLLG